MIVQVRMRIDRLAVDDAFISRIHVVIRYENLSQASREKIWKQFFDKLSDERLDFVITPRARAYVLENEIIKNIEWNGREIRNGNIFLSRVLPPL